MRIQSTRRFERSYAAAPTNIQKAVRKQVELLTQNLRHPSLRTKRFAQRGAEVWQARINRSWRFYFTAAGDTYVLIDMIEHPK